MSASTESPKSTNTPPQQSSTNTLLKQGKGLHDFGSGLRRSMPACKSRIKSAKSTIDVRSRQRRNWGIPKFVCAIQAFLSSVSTKKWHFPAATPVVSYHMATSSRHPPLCPLQCSPLPFSLFSRTISFSVFFLFPVLHIYSSLVIDSLPQRRSLLAGWDTVYLVWCNLAPLF